MPSSQTKSQPHNVALVTGASAGIGEATALKLSARGYSIVLVARRLDRLESLAEKCKYAGAKEVLTHVLDVRSLKDVENFFANPKFADTLSGLRILVNNAGLAKGVGPIQGGAISDWSTMFETNVMGLLYVTRLALATLIKNQGHILNVGSVAGIWAYPGGNVYCATKAAVRSLSEGLRMDLQGTRVRVTNIEPGMVETEFARVRLGDDALAKKVYENFSALSANDVAECIDWSISRPAHVNIQEMVVFPTDQAGVSHIYRENQKTT